MRHELKTDPRPFAAVWVGTKLYEIRKDDRHRDDTPAPSIGFQVGDELLLRETEFSAVRMKGGRRLEYSGREVLCVVTHKLEPTLGLGLANGWCILGIKRLDLIDRKGPHDGAHWKPGQPENFVNRMPSRIVVGEGVKTRDPAYAGVDLEMKAELFNEAGDVLQYGPSYHLPPGTPTPQVMPMPKDIAKHYDKDFDANKTATAPAVAWDGEGMPCCFAHGRNTHVMDCRTCEVSLHARCSMETERRKKDVPVAVDRRIDAKQMSNKSGGHVSYYSVDVDNPSKGGPSYRAEAIDVIAALDMTFAEGEAFKAVWRCAADRCGAHKDGNDTRRDAEKVAYYGEQMTAREKKRHG